MEILPFLIIKYLSFCVYINTFPEAADIVINGFNNYIEEIDNPRVDPGKLRKLFQPIEKYKRDNRQNLDKDSEHLDIDINVNFNVNGLRKKHWDIDVPSSDLFDKFWSIINKNNSQLLKSNNINENNNYVRSNSLLFGSGMNTTQQNATQHNETQQNATTSLNQLSNRIIDDLLLKQRRIVLLEAYYYKFMQTVTDNKQKDGMVKSYDTINQLSNCTTNATNFLTWMTTKSNVSKNSNSSVRMAELLDKFQQLLPKVDELITKENQVLNGSESETDKVYKSLTIVSGGFTNATNLMCSLANLKSTNISDKLMLNGMAQILASITLDVIEVNDTSTSYGLLLDLKESTLRVKDKLDQVAQNLSVIAASNLLPSLIRYHIHLNDTIDSIHNLTHALNGSLIWIQSFTTNNNLTSNLPSYVASPFKASLKNLINAVNRLTINLNVPLDESASPNVARMAYKIGALPDVVEEFGQMGTIYNNAGKNTNTTIDIIEFNKASASTNMDFVELLQNDGYNLMKNRTNIKSLTNNSNKTGLQQVTVSTSTEFPTSLSTKDAVRNKRFVESVNDINERMATPKHYVERLKKMFDELSKITSNASCIKNRISRGRRSIDQLSNSMANVSQFLNQLSVSPQISQANNSFLTTESIDLIENETLKIFDVLVPNLNELISKAIIIVLGPCNSNVTLEDADTEKLFHKLNLIEEGLGKATEIMTLLGNKYFENDKNNRQLIIKMAEDFESFVLKTIYDINSINAASSYNLQSLLINLGDALYKTCYTYLQIKHFINGEMLFKTSNNLSGEVDISVDNMAIAVSNSLSWITSFIKNENLTKNLPSYLEEDLKSSLMKITNVHYDMVNRFLLMDVLSISPELNICEFFIRVTHFTSGLNKLNNMIRNYNQNLMRVKSMIDLTYFNVMTDKLNAEYNQLIESYEQKNASNLSSNLVDPTNIDNSANQIVTSINQSMINIKEYLDLLKHNYDNFSQSINQSESRNILEKGRYSINDLSRLINNDSYLFKWLNVELSSKINDSTQATLKIISLTTSLCSLKQLIIKGIEVLDGSDSDADKTYKSLILIEEGFSNATKLMGLLENIASSGLILHNVTETITLNKIDDMVDFNNVPIFYEDDVNTILYLLRKEVGFTQDKFNDILKNISALNVTSVTEGTLNETVSSGYVLISELFETSKWIDIFIRNDNLTTGLPSYVANRFKMPIMKLITVIKEFPDHIGRLINSIKHSNNLCLTYKISLLRVNIESMTGFIVTYNSNARQVVDRVNIIDFNTAIAQLNTDFFKFTQPTDFSCAEEEIRASSNSTTSAISTTPATTVMPASTVYVTNSMPIYSYTSIPSTTPPSLGYTNGTTSTTRLSFPPVGSANGIPSTTPSPLPSSVVFINGTVPATPASAASPNGTAFVIPASTNGTASNIVNIITNDTTVPTTTTMSPQNNPLFKSTESIVATLTAQNQELDKLKSNFNKFLLNIQDNEGKIAMIKGGELISNLSTSIEDASCTLTWLGTASNVTKSVDSALTAAEVLEKFKKSLPNIDQLIAKENEILSASETEIDKVYKFLIVLYEGFTDATKLMRETVNIISVGEENDDIMILIMNQIMNETTVDKIEDINNVTVVTSDNIKTLLSNLSQTTVNATKISQQIAQNLSAIVIPDSAPEVQILRYIVLESVNETNKLTISLNDSLQWIDSFSNNIDITSNLPSYVGNRLKILLVALIRLLTNLHDTRVLALDAIKSATVSEMSHKIYIILDYSRSLNDVTKICNEKGNKVKSTIDIIEFIYLVCAKLI